MNAVLHLLDVFAERRFQGNPLAVVISPEPLSRRVMGEVAREMNFSETTFITPKRQPDGAYRVRIFTPAREIAFAGHAVLGTGHVLRQLERGPPPVTVRLGLDIGVLPVTFQLRSGSGETAWLRAPPVTAGPVLEPERIADALGLRVSDFEPSMPIQQWGAGTAAMIAALRSLRALEGCTPTRQTLALLEAAGLPPLLYLYCRETRHRRNDLSARFFFEANGLREDPATGNAAAFLGAHLVQYGAISRGRTHLRIEQGYSVGRPSLVHLRVDSTTKEPAIEVGGRVIQTAQGELLL
jgi:trans-2,3-dihydro-3-hydroxyanthranilate isomerase